MKKNNAGGLFANKNKGKRFNFEGKNTGTDQLVRGEVVAKDEEEARKKLQRRGIKPLRISKVKATRKRRITQADILDAARGARACAVLVTSDERFGRYPRLPGLLGDAGYEVVWRDGDRTLYLRPCRDDRG